MYIRYSFPQQHRFEAGSWGEQETGAQGHRAKERFLNISCHYGFPVSPKGKKTRFELGSAGTDGREQEGPAGCTPNRYFRRNDKDENDEIR
jgi:hypothetical protein